MSKARYQARHDDIPPGKWNMWLPYSWNYNANISKWQLHTIAQSILMAEAMADSQDTIVFRVIDKDVPAKIIDDACIDLLWYFGEKQQKPDTRNVIRLKREIDGFDWEVFLFDRLAGFLLWVSEEQSHAMGTKGSALTQTEAEIIYRNFIFQMHKDKRRGGIDAVELTYDYTKVREYAARIDGETS